MNGYTRRFEILAHVYYLRFHRRAPGKAEPIETGQSSSEPKNREQFEQWLGSGQAWKDILNYAADLEEEAERED